MAGPIDWNALSDPELEALAVVLASAVYDPADVRRLFRAWRERVPQLQHESLGAVIKSFDGDESQSIISSMVILSRKRGWTDKLVFALKEEFRSNAEVKGIATIVGCANSMIRHAREMLDDSDDRGIDYQAAANCLGITDFKDFFERMSHIGDATVAVEVSEGKRRALGTGVLVGPSAVLTNWHVMKEFIVLGEDRSVQVKPAAGIVCRFDYDGESVDPHSPGNWLPNGSTIPLAAGTSWHMESRPNSTHGGEPLADDLDFVLLRLSRPAERRLPIRLSGTVPDTIAGHPVMIVQHPDGRPRGISFGRTLEFLNRGLRIAYDADTKHGSSGSGVFSPSTGDLIVLHHAANLATRRNQGVPVRLIAPLVVRALGTQPI